MLQCYALILFFACPPFIFFSKRWKVWFGDNCKRVSWKREQKFLEAGPGSVREKQQQNPLAWSLFLPSATSIDQAHWVLLCIGHGADIHIGKINVILQNSARTTVCHSERTNSPTQSGPVTNMLGKQESPGSRADVQLRAGTELSPAGWFQDRPAIREPLQAMIGACVKTPRRERGVMRGLLHRLS